MRLLLLFPGALLWPIFAAESLDVALPRATATRLVAAASGSQTPEKTPPPAPAAHLFM